MEKESTTERIFSNQMLKKLIIPLVVEQLLIMTIGVADTIMVAGVGEAAVSSVSIVDSINILLINVFAALSTGGAVVAAQFIGRQDARNASRAAKQLLLVVFFISIILMVVCLIGNKWILQALFSSVEPHVMEGAITYFAISAFSYPFIALYNSGTAIFRSMGNSKISMATSLVMNIINIGANYFFIYGLDMGVAGAALGSLLARAVSGIVVLFLLKKSNGIIHIKRLFQLDFHPVMIRNILAIGIPNGVENSMFQIGKILVQGLIASFGTVALAANAVAISVANIAIIPGMAMGYAMITVIGQCIGAGKEEQANYYIKKITGLSMLSLGGMNLLVMLAVPFIVAVYRLSPQTAALAGQIILYHGICAILIWPISFTLPNGLRAANDVKYTMVVAIISMWVFRIGFSYLLGQYMSLGVFGTWIAMTIDWLFRAVVFGRRYLSGKWRGHALL